MTVCVNPAAWTKQSNHSDVVTVDIRPTIAITKAHMKVRSRRQHPDCEDVTEWGKTASRIRRKRPGGKTVSA